MGCLKSLIGMLLVAVVAVFAFLNRERISETWRTLRGTAVVTEAVPSPELADAATSKLQQLKNGETRSVALTEVELQSLLLYKYRQLLPAFVDSPRVKIENGKIEVQARVPVERLPQLSELGEAAAFLPDTTEVGVTGTILPLRSGRIALAVDQVRAARIPLPKRLVPGALRRLGRKDEAGLPPDALALPLPPGADAAYVRGDSLVFLNNGRTGRSDQ
jgi:hypothetical protein